MPHEPSGSCSPIPRARSKHCPAREQVKPVAGFATPVGRCSCCQDSQRAASRMASRRRAAAMRLLIAAPP
jgi:hypothetical protein